MPTSKARIDGWSFIRLKLLSTDETVLRAEVYDPGKKGMSAAKQMLCRCVIDYRLPPHSAEK
jgi:hypothetical protein